jgi:hypothetical protein
LGFHFGFDSSSRWVQRPRVSLLPLTPNSPLERRQTPTPPGKGVPEPPPPNKTNTPPTWNCCPTVQGMRSPCGSSPRARLPAAARALIAPSRATWTTASTSGRAFCEAGGRGGGGGLGDCFWTIFWRLPMARACASSTYNRNTATSKQSAPADERPTQQTKKTQTRAAPASRPRAPAGRRAGGRARPPAAAGRWGCSCSGRPPAGPPRAGGRSRSPLGWGGG